MMIEIPKYNSKTANSGQTANLYDEHQLVSIILFTNVRPNTEDNIIENILTRETI